MFFFAGILNSLTFRSKFPYFVDAKIYSLTHSLFYVYVHYRLFVPDALLTSKIGMKASLPAIY